MSNLVNVVKALLGSKFDVRSFEAKNRVFEFDHQQMNTFKFVRCSKNDVRVRSMFDKMVFDPSLMVGTLQQIGSYSYTQSKIIFSVIFQRETYLFEPISGG